MNTQKALQLLFHPESYPGMFRRNSSEVQLLVWRNYSFGNYVTWALIQTGEEYIVRRVVWDQRSTYAFIEPETYCADVLISNMLANHTLMALQVHINNIPDNDARKITVDGVFSGLVYQNQKVEWDEHSGKVPCEIYKWHENTIDHFEKLFNY